MAGVLGYCQLLARNPAGPTRDEYLLRVREQAEACRDCLHNLQLIAKKPKVRRQQFPGTDLLTMVATKYESARIGFVVDQAAASHAVVADIELVVRALSALIDNAVTATCDADRTTPVVLSLGYTDTDAIYRVHDSGTGLASEVDSESIFGPTVTTKRRANGVGLGLTMALSIADAHGGDVWLESTSTAGSTFALSLPR